MDDHIGVLFYDVTTLYFGSDHEDELRKTGFSKEGRHKNPQIMLGLLVSVGGYPLAYCIHEGNKLVVDSELMNGDNTADLEANGYKYIIGAKIRNESKKLQEWILGRQKVDCRMIEYDKGNGQRLLVGYTNDRAKKDAHNREKGIRRLEKAYSRGTLTKENINRRGYNKSLKLEGDVKVSINYAKLEDDAKWDGLKGYLTNTDIPTSEVYADIITFGAWKEPFVSQNRSICFVALKVYKEQERLLKLSNINMSVDKVLELAQTIVTIQMTLPQNKQTITRTMLMKRHQRITPLFSDDFWVTR